MGTYATVSFPQFWRCWIGRLRSRKLSFCKLRFNGVGEFNEPRISVPGDHKIVLIAIDGQELVFPMKSLIGFTRGVVLRSGYSAHVANHFLGLGMFYPFVSGRGYIALLAHGEGVEVAESGSLHSPQALLLWDRTQEFSLEQNPNAFMWWINNPSVKVNGHSSAVLDERPDRTPSIFSGIWKVGRYLFLPI